MSKNQKYLLAIILVLAAVLQVYAASQKSFWEDEAETASIAQSGLSNVSQTISVLHPPLYFYSAALWGKLFGYTELPLRSLSIVFGLATIVLAFIFAYQLFNLRAAFLTAALLGLSPLFLTYAHNARYYSMSAAFSLGAAIAIFNYIRSVRPGRLLWLAAYTLCCIALVYTIYTTFTVILACVIWWLVDWLQKERDMRSLGIFIAANILVVLSFLPVFPNWLSTTQDLIPAASAYSWSIGILKSAAYLGLVFSAGETTSPVNPAAWLALAAVIFTCVYLVTRLKRLPFIWAPLMFVIVIEAFAILINGIVAIPGFQALPHRTLYALPFFLAWLASGLADLRIKPALVLCSFLSVAYLIGDINYFSGRQFLTPQLAVPWREVMEEIQTNAKDRTAVICNQADSVCGYYVKRFGLAYYQPKAWSELVKNAPDEVWWLQSNLSNYPYNTTNEQSTLKAVQRSYANQAVEHYTPQDPGIRLIKTNLLKQEDYAYRLDVYRFNGFVKDK